MENISQLQGTDASLEISLLEYGLLIGKNTECKQMDEWFAVYKCGGGYDVGYLTERSIEDLMEGKESWFIPQDVLNCNGQTLREFYDMPSISQLSSVIDYYGYENILGTSYSPLTLEEVNKMIGTDIEEY